MQGACGHGVLSISQDCFYRDLTPEQQENIASYNFDHPSAFDFDEILGKLRALQAGEAVDIPTYDFVTAARGTEYTHVEAADVILFDGILAFYNPEVRCARPELPRRSVCATQGGEGWQQRERVAAGARAI
jgi:uridine kinase